MPPLPIISGKRLVQVLGSIGSEAVRQRGGHVRLRHPENGSHKPTTIPLHKTLKRGTFSSILKDAGLPVDELAERLKS